MGSTALQTKLVAKRPAMTHRPRPIALTAQQRTTKRHSRLSRFLQGLQGVSGTGSYHKTLTIDRTAPHTRITFGLSMRIELQLLNSTQRMRGAEHIADPSGRRDQVRYERLYGETEYPKLALQRIPTAAPFLCSSSRRRRRTLAQMGGFDGQNV